MGFFAQHGTDLKKRKSKDYAFRHQCNEKPSMIPGCPGIHLKGIYTAQLLINVDQWDCLQLQQQCLL